MDDHIETIAKAMWDHVRSLENGPPMGFVPWENAKQEYHKYWRDLATVAFDVVCDKSIVEDM